MIDLKSRMCRLCSVALVAVIYLDELWMGQMSTLLPVGLFEFHQTKGFSSVFFYRFLDQDQCFGLVRLSIPQRATDRWTLFHFPGVYP